MSLNDQDRPGGWLGFNLNPWKASAIGLACVIVLVCIIFALPLVKVPVQVTEKYTETEYQQEAYTESEPYTVQVTSPSTEDKSQTLFDGSLVVLWHQILPDRWGTELDFDIDLGGKSNPVVTGSWEIADVTNTFYVTITDPGYIDVYKFRGIQNAPQSDNVEFIPKLPGTYVMRFSSDFVRLTKYARLSMVLKWSEPITVNEQRTESRDVTKYRQVPVQVPKERTVTQYKFISIWSKLFSPTQGESSDSAGT